MRELAHVLDPLDARAWIQLGELHEKRGEEDAALHAFLRAGRSPFPSVRSHSIAGACYEESGDDSEAAACYLRSLRHEPRGASPLEGLRRIAERRAHKYLRSWVEKAWEKARALSALAESSQ
jgi:hypothetical protein